MLAPRRLSGALGALVCLLALDARADDIVINEIHYHPNEKPVAEEFLELYNAGGSSVDLSDWFFSSGVEFTFPGGTTLGPGAYLVVAEDPATIDTLFGASALGPYVGRLSNDGERVVLRDSTGVIVDVVDYRPEFPWPIGADGRGGSMELIHPSLDNDLGGSWRTSGLVDRPDVPRISFVSAQSASWRYRKGTSEASSPRSAWRDVGFVEDGTWSTGRTSIGYGDGDDSTTLSDMQGSYTTLYLRHEFEIESADDVPDRLRVRLYVDDGCVAWINGVEVARVFAPGGDLAFNATGTNHEASWEEVDVANPAAVLRVGTNVLAVHALNQALTSSDFSIDAEVFRPGSQDEEIIARPTPGVENSILALDAPPQIRQVEHLPFQPLSGQNTIVTAKITDPDGVASVSLLYQIVSPGNYIPAFEPLPHSTLLADADREHSPNPAFEDPANWTTVAMLDDGNGPDDLAGDGIFTALVPGQANRTLLRYRIRAEDSIGTSIRVPYADDRSLNFAAYVYDGLPDYETTVRSVVAPGYVHPVEDLTTVPVYTLIARANDLSNCIAYDSAFRIPKSNEDARDEFNWEGTFVYEGRVYDHIRYRLRQANDRYGGSGKRSMRFRFNKGNHFRARDQYGKSYPTRWRTLNTGKMFDNKRVGNFGLTETMNANLWNMMGVPAPWFHTFHLRVVDGPDEAPSDSNGQYFGDFWGMFSAIEDYDPRFLDAHDLADGTLYKLKDGQFDGNELRRNQGRYAVTTDADFQNIRANLRPERSDQWLDDHVNYSKWYPYHTVVEAIRHYDFVPADSHSKNRAWYFEPDYSGTPFGRLWTLPWDSDASWGPNWNSGIDYTKNAIYANGGKPSFKQEYRNVIREFRDLVWTQEVIHRMIDDLVAFVDALSSADRDRWRSAPAAAGSQDFGPMASKVADMRRFAFVSWSGSTGPSVPAGGRAAHLDNLANAEGGASNIPRTPSVEYVGPAGFPLDALTFRASAFSDPQGSSSFGSMRWRAGEVSASGSPFDPRNPRLYEYPAVWESDEISPFAETITIPPGALAVGRRYRTRVRMTDNTNRTSHWSPAIEFVVGAPLSSLPAQESLRITEVMYHPDTDEDYEFVELQNVGAEPLDLIDVRFTDGIEFDFADSVLTTLEPGEFAVVVANLAVFETLYDTSTMRIAGEYGGQLENSGEHIALAIGESLTILEFTYDDLWHPDTDGQGYSLSIVDPLDAAGVWSAASGWRASSELHGTPGRPDGAPVPGGGRQLPGDSNQDAQLDLSDAVSLLRRLFIDGALPLPCDSGDGGDGGDGGGGNGSAAIDEGGNLTLLDVDGDSNVTVTDAIVLLDYLFGAGAPPELGSDCVRIEGCPNVCRL